MTLRNCQTVLVFDPENVLIVLSDQPECRTFVCLHSVDGVERNQRDIHQRSWLCLLGTKAALRQLATCTAPGWRGCPVTNPLRCDVTHRGHSPCEREGLDSGPLSLAGSSAFSEERAAGCLNTDMVERKVKVGVLGKWAPRQSAA